MTRIEPVKPGDLEEIEAEWFASEIEDAPPEQAPHLVVTYSGGDASRVRAGAAAAASTAPSPATIPGRLRGTGPPRQPRQTGPHRPG